MSTSLVVLAGAVGLFAMMGDAAIDGLIKVAAGLTALTIASSMSTGGVSSGAGILLTASALYVLAAAVEKFAALDISELLRGGISALLGLGSLVVGLVGFTKFGVASALDGLGSAMLKMSAALLILAIFPGIAYWAANLLGFMSPINFVYVVIIFLLLAKQFFMSIKLSQLDSKVRILTEQVALNEEKAERDKLDL